MSVIGEIEAVLYDISERFGKNESEQELRTELMDRLVPIYQRRARRAARQIGSFVDVADMESRVLERVWRVLDQTPLDQLTGIVKLLAVCESRARQDASRAADHLSRATRVLHRSYARRAESVVQSLGRELSWKERVELAETVVGPGIESAPVERVVGGAPVVVSVDELGDGCVVNSTHPEDAFLQKEAATQLRGWVESLPRREDRRVLLRRLNGDHPMNAPLSRYLRERAHRHGAADVAEIVLN